MLNHVLVPLDESGFSECAIKYAQNIIAPDGKITLMTYVNLPGLAGYSPSVNLPQALLEDVKLDYARLTEEMIGHAKVYLQNVAGRYPGSQFATVVNSKAENAAEAILEAADELGVDAITISTHGRSGISRWVFGSVTQKVLSAATCPVFVIPYHCIEAEDGC
ncbi:MAG: universal stress protein [Anaerolineae bacterium]|nr:universal stress protein [Anaerolineae bacterium]